VPPPYIFKGTRPLGWCSRASLPRSGEATAAPPFPDQAAPPSTSRPSAEAGQGQGSWPVSDDDETGLGLDPKAPEWRPQWGGGGKHEEEEYEEYAEEWEYEGEDWEEGDYEGEEELDGQWDDRLYPCRSHDQLDGIRD
jgi:hypothetical protein